MLVYALDIGGSSIKHGLIDTEPGNIRIVTKGDNAQLQSNQFKEIRTNVLRIVENGLKANQGVDAVGISTTGSVDTKGVVVSAGHFEGYNNISWDQILKETFNTIKIVKTANDGRASAWGEYAAYNNDKKSHMHIVVGTGVGGGIIYNNELLLGDSGQAGYVGHTKITTEKTITCSCGKMGCLETLSSAPGIVQHFKTLSSDEDVSEFNAIISLAENGNKDSINAISKGGYWLGIGIGNAMNILNPKVVTIGGGVVSATESLIKSDGKDIYFESIIAGVEFASHRRVFASCDIRKAQHGNDAGMIGAACLCNPQ